MNSKMMRSDVVAAVLLVVVSLGVPAVLIVAVLIGMGVIQ